MNPSTWSPETWQIIYSLIALAVGYWLKSKGITIPGFPPQVPPKDQSPPAAPEQLRQSVAIEQDTVQVPKVVLESMMDRMVKVKGK